MGARGVILAGSVKKQGRKERKEEKKGLILCLFTDLHRGGSECCQWWYLLQSVISKQRKLENLFLSFCTRYGRTLVPFQPEQVKCLTFHLLEEGR